MVCLHFTCDGDRIISHVYVTSDWHFGHKGITRFRTQFNTVEDMENLIMERALEILTKRDVLFCLGDMAFDMRGLEKLHALPCRKILIRGNHDNHLTTQQFLSVFTEVEGALAYKKYWFTHIPIHPSEFRNRTGNVHGHCHNGGPFEHQLGEDWHKYFNAILEFNDYRPINMQVVGTIMKQRGEDFERR